MEDKEIYNNALNKFGLESQLFQTMEECAELIVAINKHKQYKTSDTYLSLIEEIADVTIMLEQLQQFYDIHDMVVKTRKEKLQKLIQHIQDVKGKKIQKTLL